MKVTLKAVTPNAEVNIVEIARVSSTRVDKSEQPEKLIRYLLKNKHFSPFEHSYMTVEIVTSKAMAIQLLRHRSFTFQEFSQRYAKVTEIEPFELRRQADKNRQSSTEKFDPGINSLYDLFYCENEDPDTPASEVITQYLELGMKLYNVLLEAGVAKECARFILTMATQTTLYMTSSVRSWIHMLSSRDDEHAQLEIQLIAKKIKNIFMGQFPIISKALEYGQEAGL